MLLKTNLKTLVKERDITLSELAKAVDMPVSTLHGWLQGVEPKSLPQVKVVASYFGTSVDCLCFDESSKEVPGDFQDFTQEINAGVYEVILRRVKE